MISSVLKQDVVAETVREWLASGKYRCGDRIPTNDELARMFGMNQRTVSMGLNRLVAEGLLERAPRRGTLVRQKVSMPASNAVALVTVSKGDVYGEMYRTANRILQQHGLFPVVLDSSLTEDSEGIISFLKRLIAKQEPYGFLAEGTTNFPYDFLRENPEKFRNTVFLFRYHNPAEMSWCRYVLIDLDEMGRLAVEYFASKGVKRLAFPAISERKSYKGPWNSMQVQVMQSLAKYAPGKGISFDESLFWRLHGGAPLEETLLAELKRKDRPDALFVWSDSRYVSQIMPILKQAGLSYPKDILLMGTYNTPHSEKYHFPSFDMRADDVVKNGIEMLTGEQTGQKIIIPPLLVEHTV